ncbi:MAG: U32 family peptidase [Candidatus Altiarchaeota archaeon]
MTSIIAPVNSPAEVEPLAAAGADELYCGLIDSSWNRKYSPVCSPNRREWRDSNLKSFRELASVVLRAHKKSISVSLALNAPYFAGCQEEDLASYAVKAAKTGVDALMLADVGALLLVAGLDLGVKLQVSSVAGVYNSKAVAFYKKIGASRIILPRHLRLSEIRSIVKSNPGIQFEVFALYNRCIHSDGLCTFLHGGEEYGLGANVCARKYEITGKPSNARMRASIRKLDAAYHTHSGILQNLAFTCGLCGLYDLVKWNVYGVKLVGRGKPLWMREYGVRLISGLIQHIKEDKPKRGEFIRDVRSIVEHTVFEDAFRPCTDFNCFYPEVL